MASTNPSFVRLLSVTAVLRQNNVFTAKKRRQHRARSIRTGCHFVPLQQHDAELLKMGDGPCYTHNGGGADRARHGICITKCRPNGT